MVTMAFHLAAALGKGDGGKGRPSFLLRRAMMIFLYVSEVLRYVSWAKMEKNIRDH